MYVCDNELSGIAKMYALCSVINESIEKQTTLESICNRAKICNQSYEILAKWLLKSTNQHYLSISEDSNKKSNYKRYRTEYESFSDGREIVLQGAKKDCWLQKIKLSIIKTIRQ